MIIASAVKLDNEKVYIGKRHGDCYIQIKTLGFEQSVCHESTQGFITDELEFLNREDGYYHARFNNQCKEQVPHDSNPCEGLKINKEDWKACLFSEDLW